MKCKKFAASEVSWMNMMLNDEKHWIIIDAREMLHRCLRCEHLTTKDCSPQIRERIFTFLEYNDDSWEQTTMTD